jgi:hypothetical protein
MVPRLVAMTVVVIVIVRVIVFVVHGGQVWNRRT